MLHTKPLVALVWIAACVLSIYVGLSKGVCTFDDIAAGKLFVLTFEEQYNGTAYIINVTPSNSALTMECTDSGTSSPCYYLGLSGNELIHKEVLNLEDDPFNDGVVDNGGTLIYTFLTAKIICSDGSVEGEAPLEIIYQNVNEAAEITPSFETSILELSPRDSVLLFSEPILISDPDVVVKDLGDFKCELFPVDAPFAVSCITNLNTRRATATATVTIDGLIDYDDDKKFYEIELQVTDTTDGNNTPIPVSTTLLIDVINVDDLDPAFNNTDYRANITEGVASGTLDVLPMIDAYDQDLSLNEAINYSLEGDANNNLSIDDTTGVITVLKAFDRESLADGSTFTVDVKAKQAININRYTTAPLVITVADVNDECPVFDSTMYTGQVSSDDLYVRDGAGRLIIIATDDDEEFNGMPYLEQDGGVFELVPATDVPGNKYLELYFKLVQPQNLNTDGIPHLLKVIVNDTLLNAGGPCQITRDITVDVVNRDPVFNKEEYTPVIDEMSPVGTTVVTVSAKAFDNSTDITYALRSSADNTGIFSINEISGEIIVQDGTTDADGTMSEYALIVEAQDRRNEPIRYSTVNVFITLNDTNDNCPEFLSASSLSGHISSQDVYVVTPDNQRRLTLIAKDNDTSEFIGNTTTDSPYFTVQPSSIDVNLVNYNLKVTDFNELEQGQTYTIQVLLEDTTIPDCAQDVSIDITVIDLSPKFNSSDYSEEISEGDSVNTPVVTVSALTHDNVSDIVVYSLKSSTDDGLKMFTIDEKSGSITVLNNSTNAERISEYTLVVEAQDRRYDPIRSSTANVFVQINDKNDNCPGFLSSSLSGHISSQDVYVVTVENEERLVIAAKDNDTSEFIGNTTTDSPYFIVQTSSIDVNLVKYNLKVTDFNELEQGQTYTIQVLLEDTTIPDCAQDVSIDITVFDLSPKFNSSDYSEEISEGDSVNTPVVTVSALTHDNVSDIVVYSLKSSTDDGLKMFTIDEKSGSITVLNNSTNAERISEYTLVVEAQDRRYDPIRSSTANVFVQINDKNDNCPEFLSSSLSGHISSQDVYVVTVENEERLVIAAKDNDTSEFIGNTTTDSPYFIVQTSSIDVNLVNYNLKVTDFNELEQGQTYTIQVLLEDTTIPDCAQDVSIDITVFDLSPKFNSSDYSEEISEGDSVNTPVVTVSALTHDKVSDIVVYSLKSSTDDGLKMFTIDEKSGSITVLNNSTNAERISEYTLVVEAQDRRYDPIRSSTANVFVQINDKNDNCPEFLSSSLSGHISSQDVYVVTVENEERLVIAAKDNDTSEFIGNTTTDSPYFIVQTSSIDVNLVNYNLKVTDFNELEQGQTYTIQVLLEDTTIPDCAQDVSIDITVFDLSPKFNSSDYSEEISEGDSVNTHVVTVSALTHDKVSDIVVYSLKSSTDDGLKMFTIDEKSGSITVLNNSTNAERISEYTLVVEAQDRRYDPIRSSTANVFVQINDKNDNCPEFLSSSLSGHISSQDVYVVTVENEERLVIAAKDNDTSEFIGNTTTDSPYFIVQTSSIDVNLVNYNLKVTDFNELEQGQTYTIQVLLEDTTIPDCAQDVSIDITVFDLSPKFNSSDYSEEISEGDSVNTPVVTVSALTHDKVSDIVVYSLKSSTDDGLKMFTIDEKSGSITVLNNSTNAERISEYALVVEAQDRRYDPIRSSTANVFVQINDKNDNCPEFLSSSLSGHISSQDVYVVTVENEERLVIAAKDNDTSEFIGNTTTDSPYFIVQTSSIDVNLVNYNLKVTDFNELEQGQTYTIQVLLEDTTIPDCAQDVSIDITVFDLSPKFNSSDYSEEISEGDSVNTPVVTVSALTHDKVSDIVVYSLKSSTDDGLKMFTIDEKSGSITVLNNSTNAERISEYTLVVEAQDRRYDPIRSSTANVFVQINDKNDNCPEFLSSSLSGHISSQDVYVVTVENEERLVIAAKDNDTSEFIGNTTTDSLYFIVQTYSIDVNLVKYNLKVTEFNELEQGQIYTVQVLLEDTTIPDCAQDVSIDITVFDLSPKFNSSDYSEEISEGDSVNTPVVTVSALTHDKVSDIVVYSLKSSTDDGLKMFTIDEKSGSITVLNNSTNAERISEYTLVVEAQDRRYDPIRSSTANVFVQINDKNDNCPEFLSSSLSGHISSQDVYVVTVENEERLVIAAKDNDTSEFIGNTTTDSPYFIVQTSSIDVNLVNYNLKVTDFNELEQGQTYTIQVLLEDTTIPDCAQDVSIDITVFDLSPKFNSSDYSEEISEGDSVNTHVVTVSALTHDKVSDIVVYSLKSSTDDGLKMFTIDEKSGSITVLNNSTNAERISEYTLVVEAQDRRYDPIRSSTANVFVQINDKNDNCPEFLSSSLSGHISSQDVYVVTVENEERLVIAAKDNDTSEFIGNTTTDSPYFIVQTSSIDVNLVNYNLKVTDFNELEQGQTYTIQVLLEDTTIPDCAQDVSIDITVFDLSPKFNSSDYSEEISEGDSVNTPVVTVSALTHDKVSDIVVYSLKSSTDDGLKMFTIDEKSGSITVLNNSTNAERISEYALVVEAQDRRYDPIRSSTANVFVQINDKNDNCPEFLSSSLSGHISSQDVYVVTVENEERLVIAAKDNDTSEFIGNTTTDSPYFIVQTSSIDVNLVNYNLKVTDFNELEQGQTYTIQVLLEDTTIPDCAQDVSIDITVFDLSPKFNSSDYSEEISEGDSVNTPVVTVSALTHDKVSDIVVYSLKSSTDDGLKMFTIDEKSGSITVLNNSTNAERISEYTLVVEAQDRRYDPIRSSTANVFVQINDKNDNCPEFLSSSLSGHISSQDVYVVTVENEERLVIAAKDNDTSEFIGNTTTDSLYFIVQTYSIDVNLVKYNLKVTEFNELEQGQIYTVQVLLEDTTIPDCAQDVSIDITVIDLSPKFNSSDYSEEISEGDSVNTPVVTVSALTHDKVSDIVVYSLKSSTDDGLKMFTIDEKSGSITVLNNSTNAERISEYTLVVEAQDRRYDPIRSSIVNVFIRVNDVNDNCPIFEKTFYTGNITRQDVFVVGENLDILTLIAVDLDMDFIGGWNITEDDSAGSFELVDVTPPSEVKSLYLSIKLVNHTGIVDGILYNLMVSIEDGDCKSNITEVTISVSDSLAPTFDPPEYETSILEGTSMGTDIIQISAFRQDNSADDIFYRLKSINNGGDQMFTIHTFSGMVSTISNQTNAESVTEYTLVVEAEDRGTNPARSSSTTVIIHVNNTNDICPVFVETMYNGVITDQDKYVVQDNLETLVLIPTDGDIKGFDGSVELLGSDGTFGLEETLSFDGTLLMVYIVLLDPALLSTDSYILQVSVTDNTTEPHIHCTPSITNVTIQVLEDLAPVFTQEQYNGTIDEMAPPGTHIVTVVAVSLNLCADPPCILYKLTRGNDLFRIDQVSGEIEVKLNTTDYEMTNEHTLVVEAQDRSREPFRTASVSVIVYVNDIDDECPRFEMGQYSGQISLEDRYVLLYGTVERLVITARDIDTVFNGTVSIYNDTSGGSFALLNAGSSDTQVFEHYLELVDETGLDNDQEYQLVILLSDTTSIGTDCTSLTTVTINVENFAPSFTDEPYFRTLNETDDVGTAVITVNAINKDGTSEGIIYSLLSATNNGMDKFTVSSSSGIITLINTLDAEDAIEYTLFVEAQDTRTEIIRSTTTSVYVTVNNVNDNCPVFLESYYSGHLSSQDTYVVTKDNQERMILEAADDDAGIFVGNAFVTGDISGAEFQVVEVPTGSGYAMMDYYIKVKDFTQLQSGETYTIEVSLMDDENYQTCNISVANVSITVLDLSPYFTPDQYFTNITEGTMEGEEVVTVSALNHDSNSDGIVYSLKPSNDEVLEFFRIDSETGVITVTNSNTDADGDASEYTLVVEAQDRRLDPIRSATATVFVSILDENDLCPVFASTSYSGEITRQDVYVLSSGNVIDPLVLIAKDQDSVFNGTYRLSLDNSGGIFALEQSTPPSELSSLYLSIRLEDQDRLVDNELYYMEVSISDDSVSNCLITTNVTISVADSLAPVFDETDYSASICEDAEQDTFVLQVTATGSGSVDKIFYRLQSANNNGSLIFGVEKTSGNITVISDAADAETTTEYTLVVEAEDRNANPARVSTTAVVIQVKNINDECPRFSTESYSGVITTQDKYAVKSQSDLERLVIIPVDMDIGGFDGDVTLLPGMWNETFDIESVSDGINTMVYITLLDPMLEAGNYIIQLSVSDDTIVCDPSDPLTLADVNIQVLQDLAPKFTSLQYNGTIQERATPNTPIVTVTAMSQNNGTGEEQIFYQLKPESEYFQIDPILGDITVKSGDEINYEKTKEYTLLVEAQDRGIEPFRTGSALVTVFITDINDLCPEFETDQYTGQVSILDEYVVTAGTADRLVLVAIDNDSTFSGNVSIVSDSSVGSFYLERIGDKSEWYVAVVSGSIGSNMTYELKISLNDTTDIGDECNEQSTVIISVEDFNPKFSQPDYTADVDERADEGTEVINVNATNQDGSPDGIEYSIRSATDDGMQVFHIDSDTGIITVTSDQIDADSTSKYTLFVVAQDTTLPGTRASSANVVITINNINDQCPVFKSPSYSGEIGQGDEVVIGNGGRNLVITAVDNDLMFDGEVTLTNDSSGGGFDKDMLDSSADPKTIEYLVIVKNSSLIIPGEVYTLELSVTDTTSPYSCQVNTTTVEIISLDTLAPVFRPSSYSTSVLEEVDTPHVIQVTAFRSDNSTEGLVYKIKSATDTGLEVFSIATVNGTGIISAKAIDLENEDGITDYLLFVEAEDRSSEPYRSAGATVAIAINDTNDNCPMFEQESYQGQIIPGEAYVIKDGIPLVLTAMDKDKVYIGSQTTSAGQYDVEEVENSGSGTNMRLFHVVNTQPSNSPTDANLTISLTDDSQPCENSNSNTTVTITVVNDTLPRFEEDRYDASIIEGAPVGWSVINVTAFNSDNTTVGIDYILQSATNAGEMIFKVARTIGGSGEISVISDDTDVDDGGVMEYSLFIEAQDRRDLQNIKSTSTAVVIRVDDTNDNPPSFEEDVYFANIAEDALEGYPVVTVLATDKDRDDTLLYYLTNTAVPFIINNVTGLITLSGKLDRDEGVDFYTLGVTVTDGKHFDSSSVSVTVLDVNDNSPVFNSSDYALQVSENTTMRQIQVFATDNDVGNNSLVTYSIQNSMDLDVSVDPESGLVTFFGPFYIEDMIDEVQVVVKATDNGSPDNRMATAVITLHINDINDKAPLFLENSCGSISIWENLTTGVDICNVLALDMDQPDSDNSHVDYSVMGRDAAYFNIVNRDGFGYLQLQASLLGDEFDELRFIIEARDNGVPTQITTLDVSISVQDVNDNAPVFLQQEVTEVVEAAIEPGKMVTNVGVTDADQYAIIFCEFITGGSEDYFFITSNGDSCTLSTTNYVPVNLTHPYTVMIRAYNPDNRNLTDPNSKATISVYVGEGFCFVTIDPEPEDARSKREDIIAGEEVTVVMATSSCIGDVGYNITEQMHKKDTDADASPSSIFEIGETSGVISSTIDGPAEGLYTLTVAAFNQSAPGFGADVETIEITILPNDNRAPVFAAIDTIILDIPQLVDFEVYQLNASDPDAPLVGAGDVVFTETAEVKDSSGEDSNIFSVRADGKILLSSNLLDVGIEPYSINLTVMAADNGLPSLNDTTVVIIRVKPPITKPPVFLPSDCDGVREIDEESVLSDPICTIQAHSENEIKYSFIDDSQYFSIDPDTGEIHLIEILDYEDPTERKFVLVVSATDDTNDLVSSTSVAVSVLDINDNAPVFEGGCFDADQLQTIVEGAMNNAFICQAMAVDGDATGINSTYSAVTYSLNGTDSAPFDIDEDSGDITVRDGSVLDRETKPLYEFTVVATDGGDPIMTSGKMLSIRLLDVNDEPPVFTQLTYRETYDDPVEPGVLILTLTPEDADEFPSDIIQCSIDSIDDSKESFYIASDGENCTLTTSQLLDVGQYSIAVLAFNPDDPSLRSQMVQVNVLVGSEYCFVTIDPKEYTKTLNVSDVIPGQTVVTVMATSTCDGAPGDIVFNITQQKLKTNVTQEPMDSTDFQFVDNGNVALLSPSASIGMHTLEVRAYNASDPDVSEDFGTVEITVLPISNTAPEFDSELFELLLVAPMQINEEVFVLADVATDEDYPIIDVGEVVFGEVEESSDGSDPDIFTVTTTGAIQLTRALTDFESAYTVYLTVSVTDKGSPPLSDTALVVFRIEPSIPQFVKLCPETVSITEGQEVPVFICNVTAVGGGEITYSLSDTEYFSIDDKTGEIFTQKSVDYEDPAEKQFLITVKAENNAFKEATTQFQVITVDMNDNAPEFEQNGCANPMLLENATTGALVCRVLAVDRDQPNTDNSLVTYSLIGENTDSFSIAIGADGYADLTLNTQLDREVEDSYMVTILAVDNGVPSLNSTKDVLISIGDVNDMPPEFEQQNQRVVFDEQVEPGTMVTSSTPIDGDYQPSYQVVLCSISSPQDNNSTDFFYVTSDGKTCFLYAANIIPEDTDPYTVIITAYNPDNPNLISDRSSIEINVYVTQSVCFVDIQPGEYVVRVAEVMVGEGVVNVTATSSCEAGSDGDIQFGYTMQMFAPFPDAPFETSHNFTIDPLSGIVSSVVSDPAIGVHIMTVIAFNVSDPDTSQDQVEVEITVVGIRNNPPEFFKDVFYPPTLIVPVIPSSLPYTVIDLGEEFQDPDRGQIGNGEYVFILLAKVPNDELFALAETGKVLLVNYLVDVDAPYTVNMTVLLSDKGVPALTDHAMVVISIELPDPSANPPVFEDDDCANRTINEEQPPPVTICTVQATSETGAQITYTLEDQYFNVDPDSGEISTAQKLDHEEPTQRELLVLVKASSIDGDVYKTITVNVADINDNAPVFQPDEYTFPFQENPIDKTNCSVSPVGQVYATDNDFDEENIQIEYKIVDLEDNNISIDPSTGMILAKDCINLADYASGFIEFSVVAENIDLYSTANVTVEILDVNDNAPVFSEEIYYTSVGLLEPDLEIIQVEASDMDQGLNKEITYHMAEEQEDRIVIEYFILERTTGVLKTRDGVEYPTEPADYTVAIEAHDQGSPPKIGYASVEIEVAALEPIFKVADRNQSLDFTENIKMCTEFRPPSVDDSIVIEYQILSDSSLGGFEVRCVDGDKDFPALCSTQELDSEKEFEYTVVVRVTTCNDTDDCPCNRTDETSIHGKDIAPEVAIELERNDVQLIITVNDTNDNYPEFGGFYPGLGQQLFIGVSDDAMYNSTVFYIEADDPDITSSSLYYSLTQENTDCFNEHTFVLNNDGALIAQEPLYAYLTKQNNMQSFSEESAFCTYDVEITDGELYNSTSAKIKILYVYEHIILQIQKPPADVQVQQVLSCIHENIPDVVLIAQDLRARLLDVSEDSSLIDPEKSDLWVYAINTTTKTFVTAESFNRSWKTVPNMNGKCSRYGLDWGPQPARPIRIQDFSYAGFALIGLAAFMGLAGLLCMFALFYSWDSMQEEKRRMPPPQQPTKEDGFVNLAYTAESVYEAESIHEDWIEPMEHQTSIDGTQKEKIKLFDTESQELTMEMFNETDDFEDGDEVILIPPKSPTEVHVLVGDEGDMAFVATGNEERDDVDETDEVSVGEEAHGSDDNSTTGQDNNKEDEQGELETPKGDLETPSPAAGDLETPASPPIKGLITFFEDPPAASTTDDVPREPELIPMRKTPPRTPSPPPSPPSPPPPPPPPPPPSQDEGAGTTTSPDAEFPEPPDFSPSTAETKTVVFKAKDGDTTVVTIPLTSTYL